MRSLEHSDTSLAGNSRSFLRPSPSWPGSGIGLLLQASKFVNQPQSTRLSGVDLLLNAADLIESESTLVFDNPESGINLLLEASELIESCASTSATSNSQMPALPKNDAASSEPPNSREAAMTWLENHTASIGHEGCESTGHSHCQPVDCTDPVDTAISWLEREVANSKKDAGKHLSPDKTVSPSTEGPSSAKSVTSSSRPGKSHWRKINGSKITKVTAASGCTCLGQQMKTFRKTTMSRMQKRRSADRDYMSVCYARKTKNNKISKMYDIITSIKCKKLKGSTPVRAYVKIPSYISQKAHANWTSGQTPSGKDTSTRKQDTSGQGPLLSGTSSAIRRQFHISRKRPVQVVMPIRSVNQTSVPATPAKRQCPISPRPGCSPLRCPDTETRPLTRHQNRLAINGVRRKRLTHVDEPKSSPAGSFNSGTSYGHRPIGVVVPWVRSTTPHTNSSEAQHDLEQGFRRT